MTHALDTCLVDPAWLATHLTDPDLRVVEVDVSRAAYDDWHIDGAVLWNIYSDLKDTEYGTVDATRIQDLIERSGIGPESTVVFYGYAPALGVWLLTRYGHRDARILNCSRDTWRQAGLPWTSAPGQPLRGRYHLGDPDPSVGAGLADVRAAVDRGVSIVDVRTAPEFDGERFWPSGAMQADGRAGHVPHAVHQPIDGLYRSDGSFLPASELRRVLSAVDVDGDGDVITYCTIGGRAATAWFVLTRLLGRDHVRVYDGSWAEWGRTPDAPVSTSPAS